MLNVVLPIAGNLSLTKINDSYYPRILVEENGSSLLEKAMSFYSSSSEVVNFILIALDHDIRKYHIDKAIKYFNIDSQINLISQQSVSKGAVCSSLLSSDLIDSKDELIIANISLFSDLQLDTLMKYYRNLNADGGLLYFKSIFPHWSYCVLNNKFFISKTAEKTQISNNALAGFYYFKSGSNYITCAEDTLLKRRSFNNLYYNSLVYNELILKNQLVVGYKIREDQYLYYD